MKPMTIWQRLDRALLLLIFLLFVAVGLAFWVAMERASSTQRCDRLDRDRDGVFYDVMLMIDSLRGMSADPKSEAERKRHREAEHELGDKLDGIQKAFKDFPNLLGAVKGINDFARMAKDNKDTLVNFHDKVMAIADSDVAGALSYFTLNYPAVRNERDRLFKELSQQVEEVHTAEKMREMTVSLVGGTCIILVALIAYFVGRQQSSAIAEPLNRLVGNLDRMRRGDFSERLS